MESRPIVESYEEYKALNENVVFPHEVLRVLKLSKNDLKDPRKVKAAIDRMINLSQDERMNICMARASKYILIYLTFIVSTSTMLALSPPLLAIAIAPMWYTLVVSVSRNIANTNDYDVLIKGMDKSIAKMEKVKNKCDDPAKVKAIETDIANIKKSKSILLSHKVKGGVKEIEFTKESYTMWY